ncbi:MAG TPA: fused MFS/spermidine synthase [bacterium]|nr:fused MFS/spermidine synthase [bacterium]
MAVVAAAPSAWMRRAILLIFVASGASALIYELVWMRRLTLVFGSTTLAVSTVLAAFMGGLALGGLLLGCYADRRPHRALFTYGLLEIGIALVAAMMPLLFRAVEAVYLGLYPRVAGSPQLFVLVQFLLAGAVIVVPATLMGGTLPLLSKTLVHRQEDVGGGVGALYAANTLGAGAGVALATYLLLPLAGLWRSQLLAALLNLAAGGVALVIDGALRIRRVPVAPAPVRESGRGERGKRGKAQPGGLPEGVRVLLLGTALSGFAAMLYEVAWARALGLVFGSSVYAFGMMVLLFLVGSALGSALFARLRLTLPQTVAAFALVEAGIAAAGVAGAVLIPRLPLALMRAFPMIQHSFPLQELLRMFLAGTVILPAAIMFGVAFPAVVTATTGSPGAVGRGVGVTVAVNTSGTVAGAFLGGFVFIPQVGLRATLLLAAGATTAAAATALVLAPLPLRRGRRRLATAFALIPLAVALLLPSWPREVLASGAGFYAPVYKTSTELLAAVERTEVLFYKDGVSVTLTVDRSGGYRFYRVNGKTDASTHPGDMANQLLLGHLPMLLHPAPQEVFILGLGTGVTAAAVARYPVRRIDVVDLEPAAPQAAHFFEVENRRVLADPRTRLITADGRAALLARPQSYDVIISDPSDVWVAGVGTLFTREFYQIARSRLRPGGVMVQWFHTHVLPPEQMKLIVSTFRSVFPHASLWRPNRGDVILLGSVQPGAWEYGRLRQRIAGTPGVEEDLRGIGLWHPLALFAPFVLEGEDLTRMLASVRGAHSDDRPVIEFLAPRSLYADTTPANDEGVQRLQRGLMPVIRGYRPDRDLDARAAYLLGFGYASLGRTDLAINLMSQGVRRDPRNAKYLIGLAHQYRGRGQGDRAAALFRRALGIAPAEAEAALALAALLREQREEGAAAEVLRAALSASPQDVGLLLALGTLLLDAHRPREALPLLARAVTRDPKNGAVRLLHGRMLRALGRRAEAVAALRRAAVLLPEDVAVTRELGEALLEDGQVKEAVEALERTVALDGRDVEALVALAKAARRRGDLAGARRARERALQIDPYHPAVLELSAP